VSFVCLGSSSLIELLNMCVCVCVCIWCTCTKEDAVCRRIQFHFCIFVDYCTSLIVFQSLDFLRYYWKSVHKRFIVSKFCNRRYQDDLAGGDLGCS
jgi:hypothetical protein